MTHTREIAWASRTQCQTSKNTFQIADLAQHGLQLSIAILQSGNGLLAAGQCIGIANRHMQPTLKHAAAHWGNRVIEHRGEGIFHTTCQILGDLQVTARRSIHDDAVLLTFHCD